MHSLSVRRTSPVQGPSVHTLCKHSHNLKTNWLEQVNQEQPRLYQPKSQKYFTKHSFGPCPALP